jgi:hypothetical protein
VTIANDVQDRYGTEFLVGLTNPADPNATSINTTTLGKAVLDVGAAFEIHAGLELDDTDSKHVMVAVEGVIAILKIRMGLEKEKLWTDWIKNALEPLSLVTSRDRVGPLTSSPLTTSSETTGARPDFDRERFRDVLPTDPRESTGDIDRTE